MKRIKRLGIVLCFLLCIYEYAQGKTEFRIMDESAEEQELQLITEKNPQYEAASDLSFQEMAENTGNDEWIREHAEGISFQYCVTQEDVARIAELKNLRHLSITISNYDDIDLSPLGSLTQLQELSMLFIGSGDVDLSFIKNLQDIKSIYFEGYDGDSDLSIFADLMWLRNLSVEYLTDVDLSHLSQCVNLREIHIIGQSIRNVESLSHLTQLESLYLWDNGWWLWYRDDDEKSPMDLSALTGLSELRSLYLINIKITDVEPLAELHDLKFIMLAGTDVEDVKALRNLENLTDLHIYGNKNKDVKEQAEMYMKHVESVIVEEEIPSNI